CTAKARTDALGAVDAVLLVHRLEQLAAGVGRLRAAEKQVAAGVEGEVEHAQHFDLNVPVQIDHQVAAGDQVEPGKRRIAQDVVASEEDAFAQLLLHAVVVLFLEEILAQSAGRYIGDDGFGINAGAGGFQRTVVDIGGEQLYVNLAVGPAQLGLIGKEHGQRIGLFAA